MGESTIEDLFKRKVEAHGGKALKFTPEGWAGAPDRIVLLPGGRVKFVELKAEGKRPRKLQKKRARELQALGFSVFTVDTAEEIERVLE